MQNAIDFCSLSAMGMLTVEELLRYDRGFDFLL